MFADLAGKKWAVHRFFLQPVIVSTWLLYSCTYVWGILILYLSIYNVFADLAGKKCASTVVLLQKPLGFAL